MPNDVIDRVHVLARRTAANVALIFADRYGEVIPDFDDDDDIDDEDYTPPDNDDADDDDDPADNYPWDDDNIDANIAGVNNPNEKQRRRRK
jgi:hypothetical protein